MPENVRQTINEIISSVFEGSNQEVVSSEKHAKRIRRRLRSELNMPYVDRERIALALDDPSALEQFIIRSYEQTQQAFRVFEHLDEAGKGVVVVEDLQRVCQELDQKLDIEEMEEMIQYVNGEEEGMLSKEDVVKIAMQVGL